VRNGESNSGAGEEKAAVRRGNADMVSRKPAWRHGGQIGRRRCWEEARDRIYGTEFERFSI
jgi:hypothetical protein